MSFNRNAAVQYADRYWNIPADDGTVYIVKAVSGTGGRGSTEVSMAVSIADVRTRNVIPTQTWQKAPVNENWQPFFVNDGKLAEKLVFRHAGSPDIVINEWAGLADCAHFLSRCLTAGGVRVQEAGVPKLLEALQRLSNTKTLCQGVSRQAGQRVIDTGIFRPGDVIGYFNIDPNGDYGGAHMYSHSAMYVGKINGKRDGGIACHTVCRFPGRSWLEDSWWLKPAGHYAYTLIHFSDDDRVPSGAGELVGWWQLNYPPRLTRYCLVQWNGLAHYARKAPPKGVRGPFGAGDPAYWFMAPNGDVTFVQKDGTVELWTRGRSGYSVTINGAIRGDLTKLS